MYITFERSFFGLLHSCVLDYLIRLKYSICMYNIWNKPMRMFFHVLHEPFLKYDLCFICTCLEL